MPNIYRLGGALGAFVIGCIMFSFMNFPSFFPFAEYILPVIWAGFMGCGTFIAFPKPRTLLENLLESFKGSGVSKEELDSVIAVGMQKVQQLIDLSSQISDRHVSMKVEQIASVADRIFEGFVEDPDDIRRSRDFLAIYLDRTVQVVSGYVRLENKGDAVGSTLTEVKSVLDVIQDTFEKQYEKNLQDDILDLSVLTASLDKKMRMSGVAS